MQRVVITDNTVEKLEYIWDGERVHLVCETKGLFPDDPRENVIVLNPEEMEVVDDLIRQSLSEPAGE